MGHNADGEITTRDFRAAKTCGLLPIHVFRGLRILRIPRILRISSRKLRTSPESLTDYW